MATECTNSTLSGGYANPPVDAALAFRKIMQAMARPGSIYTLAGVAPPLPLNEAAGAIILSLCDTDTPIHLAGDVDCTAVRQWVSFHTGSPITDASACQFAVGSWDDLLPLSQFLTGTADFPDRSATLILACETLSNSGASLHGPGIRDSIRFDLPDIDAFVANHALFPLGLDFFFTCQYQVAALPRSTVVGRSEEPTGCM